jgi:hypothetical protein
MSYNTRRIMELYDAEHGIETIFKANGLIVGKDQNDKLHVDCNRAEIGYDLHTSDILEATAALMHSKALWSNKDLWSIRVSENDLYESDPVNALYWLSGGDSEWVDGFRYKHKWSEVVDVYANKFEEDLFGYVSNCSSLGDIRSIYCSEFKLRYFYEFALANDFIIK